MSLPLYNHVKSALVSSAYVSTEGEFLSGKISEAIENLDTPFLSLLLKNKVTKEHFFNQIDDAVVLDQNKLFDFFNAKEYFDSSYTSYTNKIGLIRKDSFIKKFDDTVLVWPYKDCILEGGMSSEDTKKEEVFYNTIISKEEIDRLFEPKVLTNIKKYSRHSELDSESNEGLRIEFAMTIDEITIEDNLILKGNNLLALHSLKKRYIDQNGGKIKLIYIDPPYNTGNDGFKYNDRFNHSTWLTFMKNRLEVARELLRDNGTFVISIDQKEIAYLLVLLDEIFGQQNRKNIITIKRGSVTGAKVINPGVVNISEFVVIYSKNDKQWKPNRVYITKEWDKRYGNFIKNFEDGYDRWKFITVLEAFSEKIGIKKSQLKRHFGNEYEAELEKFVYQNANNIIQFATLDEKSISQEAVILKKQSEEISNKIFVLEREGNKPYIIYNGKLIIFISDRLLEVDGEITFAQPITDIWDDVLPNDLHNEGGVELRKGKKPEKLLQRIIELTTSENDIVLDYHLGSGTTAATAHKMKRRYIGIEQMDYIESLAVERLKNMLLGEQSGISKFVNWAGGGSFVYAELKTIDDFQDADTICRLNDNMRYLPIGEIDDESYGVSDDEKRLNKQFYGIE